MKSILIFEEFNSGHHLIYLKYIAEYFYSQGYKVTVLCRDKDAIVSKIVNSNITIENISFNKYNKISFWYKLNKELIYIEDKYSINFDVIFFNWLDTYISPKIHHYFIDLLFKFSFSGIVFHPSYFRNINKSNSLITLKSKKFKNLFVLDSGVIEPIKKYLQTERVYKLPDFADNSPINIESSISEKIIAIKKNRKIVLSIGSLAKRKGLLTLLRTSERFTNSHLFVFVGTLAIDTYNQEELAEIYSYNHNDNIFFYFKSVESESDFNAIINCCDILFAGYEEWLHSSNLLAKASIMQKPLIVSDAYYMGEMLKKYNMGEVFDGSVDSLTEVISTIKSKYDFSSYLEYNSIKHLKILEKLFYE